MNEKTAKLIGRIASQGSQGRWRKRKVAKDLRAIWYGTPTRLRGTLRARWQHMLNSGAHRR